MKKRFKFTLTLIGLLLLSVLIFYIWGSSPWYLGEANQVKTFNKTPAEPKDTLKVMTYNIGYLSGMKNNLPVEMPEELFNENLVALIEFLEIQDPDIIGFQEIDFGGRRSHYQNQLDSIAKKLGYHMAYSSINWDKNYVPFPYWPPKYHFGKMLSGQAILSKYPISNVETVILDKPINAPFYYNKFYLDRLIQIVDITIGDEVIKVMNLHLEAFDAETREQQAFVAKYHFEKYAEEMPVLLVGDFNSQPYWEENADMAMKTILSYENLVSNITKVEYASDKNSHYTFSSGDPYQMIDYVLYNPEHVQKIAGEVVQLTSEISDHFPVMMTFTFKPQNDSTIQE